ncbi:MAG: peptidylprolyl isomerase, partial [Dehalococcoidia bacterium]|nr:peptidylprolyl isomerase [Dehalococcoidia bacterium]
DLISWYCKDYRYSWYAEWYLDYTESSIVDITLINTLGPKLGANVTDADVKTYMAAVGMPNNSAMRDYARSMLIAQRLRDDYFGPNIPVTAEYRDVVAMFLESQSQVDEIRARINAGESFSDIATEYSLEDTTKENGGALGNHSKGIFDYTLNSTGFDDAIFSQTVGNWGVYYDDSQSKNLGYWLIKITQFNPEDPDSVRISGILLTSLDEAEMVKSSLDRGGNFTTLAETYSQHWSEEDGDDLGWISWGSSAAYSDFVFAEDATLGKVSEPIQDTSISTEGGYWLYRVLSSTPNKDVTSEDRADLITVAFQNWVDSEKENLDNFAIVNHFNDEKRAFACQRVEG